jgi:hypothetical protein
MEWILLDPNNLPEKEVLAANFKSGTFGYKEKLVGYLGVDERNNNIVCEAESVILENCTHYVDLEKFDIE